MILGMNYSKRKNGNCRETLEIIGSFISPNEFPILDIPDFSIRSCCDYNYVCFKTGSCTANDDFLDVLDLMRRADEIIVTIPVYRGHLCSEYYKFHERICGVYRLDDDKLVADYLDKTKFILFVNWGAGYEEAIKELERDIKSYGGYSKIIPVSSRDYAESPITGGLKDRPEYIRMIKEEFALR